MNFRGFLLVLMLLFSAPTVRAETSQTFGQNEFDLLLDEVSEGWNSDDAARAAAAFTPDAVYSEPPDKQLFIGREALFEFFGGQEGHTEPMEMIWHHKVYNPKTGVGAAEWTFRYKGAESHGVVMIKIDNGLIANGREYYYESDLDWDGFQGSNKF